MPDLGILELTIAFLLFLPLARPYIKAFAKTAGFVYLPPVALFCVIALFPAYGLHIECVPLLIYTAAFNILNYRAIKAAVREYGSRDFIPYNPTRFLISTAALVFVTCVALFFLPESDPQVLSGAETLTLKSADGNEYFLRIYKNEAGSIRDVDGSAGAGNAEPESAGGRGEPLVLTVPPVTGSVSITDGFCEKLSRAGFTVVSFSRKDFDFPARPAGVEILRPGLKILKTLFLAKFRGPAKNGNALAAAVFLEEQRRSDIEFIVFNLRNIKTLAAYREFVIAGFDEAASAALLLAANRDFLQTAPGLKSVIAVEPRLFSLYEEIESGAARPLPEEEGGSQILNFVFRLINKVKTLIPPRKKAAFNIKGSLPRFEIPVLILNKSIKDESRAGNAALLKTLEYNQISAQSPGQSVPAGFAAFRKSAILYCTDIPEKYPVLFCLSAGRAGEERARALSLIKAALRSASR